MIATPQRASLSGNVQATSIAPAAPGKSRLADASGNAGISDSLREFIINNDSVKR
jgi:hypothetical protein